MNRVSADASAAEEVRALQNEYLFPCAKPYYREPVVLVEGEGVWARDADGREYLDLFAGILTTSLGHCHPEVVARIRDQVGRLGHTSTLYITEPQVHVARRLAALAPGALRRSFFTNSGSEAIETAITVACMYTGRSEVIALRHAYSGRTFLTSNITAQAAWRPLPSGIPGIKHAMAPNPYRCPFHSPCDAYCIDAWIRDLEEVIDTTTTGRPAAFIVEPIQGVGGFVVIPPDYLRRAAELIRSRGGLFISDEVQTGFGRTGGKWWCIEHAGVTPDIIVMAKGIAGGMPVGATITTDEIAAAWTTKTISTFGGNPVCMAAADATLEVMVREDVPSRASERGAQLRSGLLALQTAHPWIGDVRGLGLMQALELVDDPRAKTPSPRRALATLEAARQEGLLLGLSGLHGNVVRVAPSLLITESEVDEALARLARACRRAESA
jgi:alanine-glyoxylate transaminase / (R)-3-amino-2-methylpropionate-pyruvate transaminase